MSYILDALKKAAEQRSGPPAEMRRLLSPAPVATPWLSRYVTLGAAAAGVIAVAMVVWVWSPAREDAVSPATPVASVVRAPAVPAPVAAEKTPTPRETPSPVAEKPAPRPIGAESRPAQPARVADTKPPRPAPPATVSPAPRPPVVAVVPPTPTPVPMRTDIGKLKVEVIVYSEQHPLRWAFISGRKYVEGDAIGDGARVEEIQPGGVVLVEDGRRITLRP